MEKFFNRTLNYIYKSLKFSGLCLRQIFVEPSFYILIITFNMVSILLWTIFVPYQFSGGVGFFFSVIDPMLLTLGWVSYMFRNSTLYNNLSSSGTSKNQFYISQIITTFITSIFLGAIFLIFLLSFNSGGVFLYNWVWEGSPRFHGSLMDNWFIFLNYLYLLGVGALTAFAMYFLIHSYVVSIKTYYIAILAVSILAILFGGILNSYFDDALLSSTEGVGYYPQFSKNIYPAFMYAPSLFYPFFGINQMFNYGVALPGMGDPARHIMGDATNFQNTFFNIGFDKERWYWAILFFQPYIFVLLSFIIGKTGSKVKE